MIEYVLGQFNALIKPIQDITKDKRELRDNALRAISHALNETRIYYQGRERGRERNLDIEAQLAKYWAAAAIPITHIDPELAMVCEQKCEYWINPDNWTDDEIAQNGIALADLVKTYRKMLVPSLSGSRPRAPLRS
jgi:hypothetical protein